jgi:hypothetical protein
MPAVVILVQQRTSTRTAIAMGEAKSYFVPDQADLPPDTTIRLMLDSGSQEVEFVKLEVAFDPTKVNLAGDVVATGRLKTVVEKTDVVTANATGRVVLALRLATADRTSPPLGVFEVAELPFRAVTMQGGVLTRVGINVAGSQVVDTNSTALAVMATSASMMVNSRVLASTSAPIALPRPTAAPKPVIGSDLNGDGCVNFTDLGILGSLYGKKVVVGMLGDLDGDGKVTGSDIGVWIKNYGEGCGK